MKVLHVGSKNYPPNHGGVEKVVYDITMDNHEFDFFILTEWVNTNEQENVKTLPNGVFKKLVFIYNFVRNNSIDVVCFHKETYSLFGIFFSIIGYKTILIFHGLAWRISRWGYFYRSVFYIMDFIACILVNKIVFVSESDRDYYKKYLPWREFYFIPNGVECNEKNKNNIEEKRLERICYLGRISPEKNILNLIRAADTYKLKLDLYGPIDKRDKKFNDSFMNLIKKSEYVQWNGAVESNKVYEVLKNYNVFINPSFSEGMPVSVLEAAANNCYLVLSNIEAHKKLNFPEVTYIDCQRIDLSNLNMKSIGNKNYDHVKKKYSLKTMKDYYNKLYRYER